MLTVIIMTMAGGLAGLLVYLYFLRKGQFEDMEDVKYQIFRNEDE